MDIDIDCDGCDENTEAELEAKQERGEELTEEEQAIVDGEEEVPTFNGPLSPANVEYCDFCHTVGQSLAIAFGAIGGGATFLSTNIQTGIGAGLAIWLLLALVVGYVGNFPILGPVFGPIVERIAASQGVYLTEKAKRKYRRETATDGGTAVDTSSDEIEDVDLDDEDVALEYDETEVNTDAQLQQLEKEKERWKKLAEKRGDEKADLKSKVETTQQNLEQLEGKKEDLEDDLKKAKKRNEKLEGRLNREVHNGVLGGSDEYMAFHPLHSENLKYADDTGGAFVGPVFVKKTVEVYIERFNQTVELAYIVTDEDDLTKGAPDYIGSEDLPEHNDHLFPKPETLDSPITHKHPGKAGYDPDNPNHRVLYWNNLGTVNETRKALLGDDSVDYYRSPVGIAWDNEGNYCPPPYDPRGFENIQELRSRKDKIERLLRQTRSQLNNEKDRNGALQQNITVLENELDSVRTELEHAREREMEAIEASKTQEHANRVISDAKQQSDRELERREEEKQQLKKDRDYHRKEKYDETDNIQTERAEAEERVAAKQTQVEAVGYLLRVGYQPPEADIDYDRLSDDSYEYDHGDVIQMALGDDEMPKKIEQQLQKTLQPEMMEGMN
ncbi:hypothetical protein NP511_18005 [Natrinema thermotolerans]|uniref:Uncharacterized protein n=1 Tax=Natrinema thermotolerans TaxID=121872 RepID=A0AAF0PA23_9EURY|nr:hypothetical protein [Natrinema thermotolerans]QCC60251.1 hypothetical protein DVR14_17075 [Natrinema thermotolerans]QCC61163.1 hypothetical protein DVR14_21205 [Natrinema thermotolerans]WMT07270.1 hypothetical protein NP511_18005 [Natrinema thermotolerans]